MVYKRSEAAAAHLNNMYNTKKADRTLKVVLGDFRGLQDCLYQTELIKWILNKSDIQAHQIHQLQNTLI